MAKSTTPAGPTLWWTFGEPALPFSRPMFVVYALADPRNGEIRYVGKSSGYLNSRYKRHLREAVTAPGATHKLSRIRQLNALGLVPELRILERAATRDELPAMERRWIADLRAYGCRLTNMTDGGEGLSNPSEETRAKLRARPQVGFGPELRRRANQALRDRWQDPEWRAWRMEQIREQCGPPREVMTGEELRLWKIANAVRMGAGNKGKAKTPEHRRKLAEANLARVDPDRPAKALALREAGLTYGAIAAALGYSRDSSAYRAVQRAREYGLSPRW